MTRFEQQVISYLKTSKHYKNHFWSPKELLVLMDTPKFGNVEMLTTRRNMKNYFNVEMSWVLYNIDYEILRKGEVNFRTYAINTMKHYDQLR